MKKIKILCTICARKGSKGLKNKNLLKLLDKPLIMHTIEQARMIKYFNKIIVSSDSKKIIEISKNKVDHCILRPKKLSNDQSSKVDAIQHALLMSENKFNQSFDLIVDLDVTSPLRSTTDITNCIKMLDKSNDIVITASETERNPWFNMVKMNKKNYVEILNKETDKIIDTRHKAPKVYDMTTVCYVSRPDYILNNKSIFSGKVSALIIPKERSIDIDTIFDLKVARLLYSKN